MIQKELDIHGKEFVSSPHTGTIYFKYDSDELTSMSRDLLATSSKYLKENPEVEVLVVGHCDERGTISYNLALGQKRAQTVRSYYLSLGVEGKRIGSLSYGKEKPECVQEAEECWAKNRRVETKIRIYKAVKDVEDVGERRRI